jgi:hypothetical protein
VHYVMASRTDRQPDGWFRWPDLRVSLVFSDYSGQPLSGSNPVLGSLTDPDADLGASPAEHSLTTRPIESCRH